MNLGKPGTPGMPSPAPSPSQTTPVYSSYTQKLIGYGPIPFGTPNDAPSSSKQFGGNFRVVEWCPIINIYRAHAYQGRM